jgi:hypothetical protein
VADRSCCTSGTAWRPHRMWMVSASRRCPTVDRREPRRPIRCCRSARMTLGMVVYKLSGKLCIGLWKIEPHPFDVSGPIRALALVFPSPLQKCVVRIEGVTKSVL